jgi:photosystem II stability/assembly factor-like uncharacterized protein
VIVGDLNTILTTTNGGVKWDQIMKLWLWNYYNKVLSVYIVGNSGVFFRMKIYQYGAHIREEYQGR